MDPRIRVERKGPVVTVRLDRPEKLNALDLATWTRLGEVFRELDGDETPRCVVVRGAGEKAFCAGADIAAFAGERSNVEQARRYGRVMEATIGAVAECRHPVVAAIRGVCVGGGLEIASVCDLRIASRSSRFGIPVARLGVTMAYGELRGLLGIVAPSTALEILLEGRVFDAKEAKDKGLVHRVVDDDAFDAEIDATVERVTAGAPLVHRWHKSFIRRLRDPRPLSEDEIEESWDAFGTEDFRAGFRAFLDKTPPRFEGR